MSQIFFLKPNQDPIVNESITLINNSFSQLKQEDGSKKGYIYRPALRMAFYPMYYLTQESSIIDKVQCYPSKIQIMKKSQYVEHFYNYFATDSLEYQGYSQNVLDQTFENSDTLEINYSNDVDSYSTDTDASVGCITFHQIVGYQTLKVRFQLTKDAETNTLIETIYFYTDSIDNPIYIGNHNVVNNVDFENPNITNSYNNKCIIRYNTSSKEALINQKIYATVIRPISVYNEFLGQSKQNSSTTLTIHFPNFEKWIQYSLSKPSKDTPTISSATTLGSSDCVFHFYEDGNGDNAEGVWSKQQAYFTRYKNESQQITNNEIDFQNNLISPNNAQSIDTPKRYILYFDYSKKKNNSSEYVLEGIQNYLNEQILFMIQFEIISYNSQGEPLDPRYIYFSQAFGQVYDYYKKSNHFPIYLLDNNAGLSSSSYQYRQFLLNGKENIISQNILKGYGFPNYINSLQYFFCSVQQNQTPSLSNRFYKIRKYRYAQKQFDPHDDDLNVKWNEIQKFDTESIDNANVKIQFVTSFSSESSSSLSQNQTITKNIYLQIADNQFNVSKVVYGQMKIYQHSYGQNQMLLQIIGTNNNQNYTGIEIDEATGSFDFQNGVDVKFSIQNPRSDIDIEYRIIGQIYDEYVDVDDNGQYKIEKWSDYHLFNLQDNVKKLYLMTPNIDQKQPYSQSFYEEKIQTINGNRVTKKVALSQGILNADQLQTITVIFRDSAGNVGTISRSINRNTKLFTTTKRNLIQPSFNYDLQLYKNGSRTNNILVRRQNSNISSSTRQWNDIFYPIQHSYPVNADGTIDFERAKKVTNKDTQYDPIVTQTDSEGRYATIWNNSKKYPDMVSKHQDISNTQNGLKYWIIDNEGYGDIKLEFEYFYLDNVAYGPPFNYALGKNMPDMLAVYDASAPGCLKQIVNSLGNKEYVLQDSTLLKILQRYTGYGQNTMSLDTGIVNASPQGAFETQVFSTDKLCLIFYSDYDKSNKTSTSPISSGFKIKSSKKITKNWQNFDVDYKNGLIWVHETDESTNKYETTNGYSYTITYDYYNTSLLIDYQDGSVIFDQQPPNDIFASYSYYSYDKDDTPPSRDFMANSDDMVAYQDFNIYFVNSGTSPNKIKNVAPFYPPSSPGESLPTFSNGKIVTNFSVDKDRGIIQFNNGMGDYSDQFAYVPRGRLFADYRYHTYQRLSNDGYSDFEFNDSVLVADKTKKYPDYSWGDIKVVNQGDAALQAGQIKFLARGVVTDNVITQVLDINRPWDVQAGTAQETYGKTGCQFKRQYSWDSYNCDRNAAKTILSRSTVNQFNVDELESKGILYGRIVICLGGTNDSYPTTTAGKKIFSAQIAGKFYQQE